MSDAILALNAGSSSLKFALYQAQSLDLLCRGEIGNLGAQTDFKAFGPSAGAFENENPPEGSDHETAASWLLNRIRHRPELALKAAGHRVVHGGSEFNAPAIIDEAVIKALHSLIPLAPGHQPHNLAAIRAVAKAWPGLPQVGCFDTAFHRTQPRLAQLFPIPRDFFAQGLLRYGFHGLSYQHIAEVLPDIVGARADGRVLAAHLGHGASLCAMKQRRSIATTMGFTALDGLMMGTRSGSIDPGLVLYLIQERGMSPAELGAMLNERSGLLGISGISDDVRTLTASADPHAAEAIDLFVYRAVREAGSLIAALGKLDVLVFTAGIGEHSPRIRAAIGTGLTFAGVAIDPRRNDAGEARISADESDVDVLVIPANEELPIARAVHALI